MDLYSQDPLSEDALVHHGTKGMKWGIWNAETRAKYLGGAGKIGSFMAEKAKSAVGAAGRGAGKAAKFASAKVSAAKTARAEKAAAKKAERAELNAQRKELGMSRAKYNELREQALKSHDPRVIEKGMHTLTDAELNEKITRLNKEQQISKMSTDLQKREQKVRQEKMETLEKNPIYKYATKKAADIADQYIDMAIGSANKKLIEQSAKSGKNKNQSEDNGSDKGSSDKNSNSSKNESSWQNGSSRETWKSSTYAATNKTLQSDGSVKNTWSKPSDINMSGFGMKTSTFEKVQRGSSVKVSSDSAKKAQKKGKEKMETVEAEVISSVPVPTRLALPPGRG